VSEAKGHMTKEHSCLLGVPFYSVASMHHLHGVHAKAPSALLLSRQLFLHSY